MKTNCTWDMPYTPAPEFSKRAAYFSMEFGIDPALKIYSGGLGYLAGSHMRSAYELKQNMIGIGMLWKFGYYDQVRDSNSHMRVLYRERYYTFLEETDLTFPIIINGHPVTIKTWYLAPEVFGTVPMYLLTTDNKDLNDYLSCTITHRLYDSNAATRVAQSIVLGIGGAKVVEALGGADIYHMNEAHALPMVFYLYNQLKDVEKVREKVVFTTHTPEKAGNEEREYGLLDRLGFFDGLSVAEVKKLTGITGDTLGYTPAALHFSGKANGVSQLHAEVSEDMWAGVKQRPRIIGITNAQNQKFWQDPGLKTALDADDDAALRTRKRELKEELFKVVADQTGKLFDPDVLTLVWARRFAGYKRADLIMRNPQYFYEMLSRTKYPVQIIWAGKPYPEDQYGVDTFNKVVDWTHLAHNATIVTGYEMNLSGLLKKGSDIWLNTPRRPREASGTSGMTAAMNASVNVSINDGWVPEFARHGVNAFIIPEADVTASTDAQDDHDYKHLMRILEEEVIPMYYDQPDAWAAIVKQSMRDVVPQFESGRMAAEYYTRMYM
ncbi:MAG: alpha-glucan family phosphorylase [Bacteroidia bacterium]|nr:alpha-glucan family phosphorylase [Bacteroidia bacterium]